MTGFPAGFAAHRPPVGAAAGGPGNWRNRAGPRRRSQPRRTRTSRLDWNAGPRAAGAILEISAPRRRSTAPTTPSATRTVPRRDATALTPARVYQKLPAAAGSRTFSALALGLPTSLSYDVPHPATATGRGSRRAGVPDSVLEVDDGLAPDGDIVGQLRHGRGELGRLDRRRRRLQVVNYDPATGTYGSVIASDTSGGQFYVFGVDPAAHTVLVDDATTGSDGTTDRRRGAVRHRRPARW